MLNCLSACVKHPALHLTMSEHRGESLSTMQTERAICGCREMTQVHVPELAWRFKSSHPHQQLRSTGSRTE